MILFLMAADQESEVERVIEELAHEWEGRIDVQLLGPMAATISPRPRNRKADTSHRLDPWVRPPPGGQAVRIRIRVRDSGRS